MMWFVRGSRFMSRERHSQGFVKCLAAVGLAAATALGADPNLAWHPVECIPADLAAEQLFEIVQPVENFEGTPTNWTAEVGEQQAQATLQGDTWERHEGTASLRVDYNFVGKKDYEYLQVNGAASFAQAGQGFGFWLKTDGTPFALRLRFTDVSGEWHQTELQGSSQPGWQFVAGLLDTPSQAWGGDGNRRKDYPCRLAGICLDRPQAGFVGKGSLWIDDAAIVRPVKSLEQPLKVEAQDRRFGNLYAVGDTVTLRASGAGERVRWAVADFFGREMAQGEGPAASAEVRFALKQSGWFSCKLELLAGGRVSGVQFFPCAALPGGAEPARSDFFGVCSHYGQDAYPLETMELLRSYGIDQFRDEVLWTCCEEEKERVVVPRFCRNYLQRAADLKLRPLIIFDYNNRFYDHGGFPNSPVAIGAFARYAVELARQTRGLVNTFEVWNEWVGGCGMSGQSGVHDGEALGRLLKPTYAAVKQAFPGATVVGIGGEYGPKCAENIIGAIRAAGPESMDAWSIHPYRYPRPPEASDLVGEVRDIAAKVASAGAKTKAWITEIGYPTHRTSGGCDEAAQARYCVRTLALLQSMPEVGKVFWYDFKDDGLTREYNEHNFGLIRHQHYNCAPKPGMVAASVFIRMTGGAKVQGITRKGNVFAAAYRRPDGRDVMVAWSVRGTSKSTWAGKVLSAFDLMGNGLTASRTFELSENPAYLVGQRLRLTDVRNDEARGPTYQTDIPSVVVHDQTPLQHATSF
jgi:hypothetical protein